MSSPTSSQPLAHPDPFPYGWRYVRRELPDGKVEFDMVPLTLLDALHPQEGDHIPENSRHERLRRHFQNVFETRLARQATLLCLSDCLIDWDREDVRGHSPDLIVLERDDPWPWRSWSTLHVREERARPRLIVEITSPSTRVNDVVEKVAHYHRVGVPLYVIVDEEGEEGPLQLVGYRWLPGGYEPMAGEEAGRLPLEPFGVYLVIVADRVAIIDAASGEEIGDYAAISKALQTEVRAREAAEERARAEAEARVAAEQQLRQQAEARAAAEQACAAAEQARSSAEQARQAAEQRERAEAEARVSAEREQAESDKVRLALEARVKELEAQLRQSGGSAS